MRQHFLTLCKSDADNEAAAGDVWEAIRQEAAAAVEQDRLLSGAMGAMVLRHACLAEALSHLLARKLGTVDIDSAALLDLFFEVLSTDARLAKAAAADLNAVRARDPACPDLLTPFLYFKGFQALQAWRVSHFLWQRGRKALARHLQSRISEIFAIDIHPAAELGTGLMLDHGTGIVIGETAVVEDDVSMLHGVTLGGNGRERGDRHPKIRRGVLIGAGAKILGNIEVGEGAKVGAGSIVLQKVEPFTTVAGVPARPIGVRHSALPALTMDHTLEGFDYVI
jgi:serine O-acetyltransferase